MGIKKGTRLTDTPKNNSLKFRYDDEVKFQLEEISQKTGETKSEIIRKGISIQYDEIKKE